MEQRLTRDELFGVLEEWNYYIKRNVHLIACGGTAMTLLGVKMSTRDVDFMAPDLKEHKYLTEIIKKLGYRQETQHGWQRPGEPFRFDIFRGNYVHTTGLLESPLDEGNHTLIRKYSKLYIGVLNDYDLICSKLMRGDRVDYDDSIMLTAAHVASLDIDKLVERYNEMILYDVAEARLRPNITYFLEMLQERGLYESK
ncbi:DUF6036 family nucleotidyltransferase [Geotalea toluenoxydans]|uniref:DUF6036 family nucleotidyltransferase n=1 Tax=Geotalea toluenoxydans TaxID=421624 RepID=UPI0006CFAA51|nr:DUF6036 family nucleotidyltransferase [Geotalea toluenoxydans]